MTVALTRSTDSPPPVIRHHFGTDGVRGVANTELSPMLAMSLGAAAAQVLREGHSGERVEVIIGRDPRISGDLLGSALIAGLLSQGVDATQIGVVPTPGVAFVTKARGAAAGVVISASHNPVRDNGIKFFGPDGRKLPDAVEARIEAAMAAWETVARPAGAQVGRLLETCAPVKSYTDYLCETIGSVRLDGLRLVLDGANGAASFIANPIFEALGASVQTLSCEPDGVNINEKCGSLHPENLIAKVREIGADAGFAFDGDADRVIGVDDKGRLFDGDRILCTLGIYLKQQGRLKNNTVVGTVMSNLGLEQALSRHDITFLRANVGDRYVGEMMAQSGAAVGGEKSGHILLPDISTTGDGLLTALQILRLCRETGRSLASWSDEMEELPQKLVSIRVTERDGWDTIPDVADALNHVEASLKGRGRLLVRPSGTEKMIRVMAEGPNADEVEQLVNLIADALRKHRGADDKA